MRIFKPISVFLLLCEGFLIYSFSIYLSPALKNEVVNVEEQNLATEGKLVWQKYNCQSCHQLYGLGGYLGPDLTNCIAQEGKGELYAKAMILSGTAQMPAFPVSEKEMKALMQFFHAMNKTGNSDPRNFKILQNGMIEPNEQN